MKLTKALHIALTTLIAALAAPIAGAASSCYPADIAAPPVTQVTIGVIDRTTFRDATAVRDYRAAMLSAAAAPGQRVVLVSFAGIATGQTLARDYDATLEAPITDEDAVANARIGPFKKSQRCVSERISMHKTSFTTALDRLLNEPASSMLERSEIVYSLRQVVAEFGGAMPVRLLVFSDGWQHSREMSFYAGGKPRNIVADTELKAVHKLGFATLPSAAVVPKAYKAHQIQKALWFGLMVAEDRKHYSDALQVAEMQKFWRSLLGQWGVNDVQIGTTLNNPRL